MNSRILFFGRIYLVGLWQGFPHSHAGQISRNLSTRNQASLCVLKKDSGPQNETRGAVYLGRVHLPLLASLQ